ncbi:MAG TPA: immunoglobulin domain-containing protein [Verrucomicrobiae bacterium]|nr:immunoglobulin domain-containing protein [Verrucomicrobiae bacterium]
MKALVCSLLLCITTHPLFAEALDHWGESPRPLGSGAPISIAYGNGLFVASGQQGTILTSSNGVDWARQNSTITNDISRVKFVNDRFFAFSVDASVRPPSPLTLTSSDGTNWSPLTATIGTTTNLALLKDVTFGNGAYFGIHFATGPVGPGAIGPVIVTSPDLVHWTQVGTAIFDDIAFGGGVFVGRVDQPGPNIPILSFSTDAQSWMKTGAPITLTQFDSEITYQNGLFFTYRIDLTSSTGCISCPEANDRFILYFSPDGMNWTNGFNFGDANFTPLKNAAGGGYDVVPAGGSVFYTTNLVDTGRVITTNWTQVSLNISAAETGYSDVAFGNNIFVTVSFGKIFVSNPVSGVAPLRLIAQPQPQAVTAGGTVSLSVLVQGSDPITYQWRRNATNIAGATSRVLTLTNITVDLAGEYDVVVTSPSGTLTSAKATVTVQFADVHFYAGVTLRGNPGDKFLLEYQDQLDPSDSWHAAANVTLTNQQSIWFDADSVAHPNRFYRATFLGP